MTKNMGYVGNNCGDTSSRENYDWGTEIMTEEQKNKCHGIIHTAATAAAAVGAGLAQLPCSDAAVIVPIQVAMIISLGAVFELSITESAAKTAIAEALGTTIGRGISQVLVGWLPGIGNAINASTAAAVTEALGWLVVRDFKKNVSEEGKNGIMD